MDNKKVKVYLTNGRCLVVNEIQHISDNDKVLVIETLTTGYNILLNHVLYIEYDPRQHEKNNHIEEGVVLDENK
jgi:hypothetical protein